MGFGESSGALRLHYAMQLPRALLGLQMSHLTCSSPCFSIVDADGSVMRELFGVLYLGSGKTGPTSSRSARSARSARSRGSLSP